MRGHPCRVQSVQNEPKSKTLEKSAKMVKIILKHKKVPIFFSEIGKTTLLPTHYSWKKKSKNDMGLPMGAHICSKGHSTNIELLSVWWQEIFANNEQCVALISGFCCTRTHRYHFCPKKAKAGSWGHPWACINEAKMTKNTYGWKYQIWGWKCLLLVSSPLLILTSFLQEKPFPGAVRPHFACPQYQSR